MQKKAWLLIASLLALALQPQPLHAADESWIKDLSIPAVYSLGNCRSSTELDCIESVEFAKRGGDFVKATFGSLILNPESTDNSGNLLKQFQSQWLIGDNSYNLLVDLETPSHVIDKASNLRGAALRVQGNYADSLNTKIRLKIRTSWLKPMNIQLKANEADFLDEIIPGGHRWTFAGYATQISDYNNGWLDSPEKKIFAAQADVDTTLLAFYIHHADTDLNKGYWRPICADSGYTVQSHNTNATGDPFWNAANESLEFSIFAPHKKADGTPNVGFFKLWTSEKFLDCKYPTNTLTKSPSLSVQVLYEDGTAIVVSTSVKKSNGQISFSAAGFHFSSPKVILKAEPVPTPIATPTPEPIASQTPTPAPIASQSPTPAPISSQTPTPKQSPVVATAKKTTITCIKGKTVTKVTALKPVCPKGYTKK
jgi:hypothetical protein